MGDVTDWSGEVLRKEILESIGIGCKVRVCITNVEKNSAEAVYLKVTKVKDGTIWGTVEPTYRMGTDSIDVEDGKTFSVRRNEISEVPIDWQPKWFQRKVSKWTNVPLKKGYSVTGLR